MSAITHKAATPEQAVDLLVQRYAEAVGALRSSLDAYLREGVPPSRETRALFRYPRLRVTYRTEGAPPTNARAFAKFSAPGVYSTTVTQPADFRDYLLEQLRPLVEEFGAEMEVGLGPQEIAYPYVFESGDELGRGGVTASELARHFPAPSLAVVGDEIADGQFEIRPGAERPLALFDAARVDYSLRRLVHYTGSDWRAMQPWVLLTNYHRYVDQFVRWGLGELRANSGVQKLVLPGNVTILPSHSEAEADALLASVVWHRFQMPAYHVVRSDGNGVSLVNIGVGPGQIAPQAVGIEYGQSDGRTDTEHSAAAFQQLVQTNRLEPEKRREIYVGIKLGPGRVDGLQRRLDAPSLGDDIRTPADQFGRQVAGQSNG